MPVEFKDYYQVLGVSPKATDEVIRKAFRTLARKYHPDVARDKKTAEETFKEINEAHEVLSHPDTREQYDRLGADWKSGPRPPPRPGRSGNRAGERTPRPEEYEFQFEGTGFSDFFEQFFGSRAGRRGGGAGPDPAGFAESGGDADPVRRGQDIQGEILITLDEVLQGALRAISVRQTHAQTGAETTETYSVRIPAGVRAGQSIRVQGKGGEGRGGGRAGDIYLRVRYAQHPDWQPRGTDLIGHLELAPWEAVLGATVPLRTLDATVSVKVPAGTQQGQQLRVRNRGLPTGTGGRGDLYVVVSIRTPAHVTAAERQLWSQLAQGSAFDARRASPPGRSPDAPAA